MSNKHDSQISDPENLGRPAPALIVFLVVPLIGILIAFLMIAADAANRPAEQAPSVGPESLVRKQAPAFELATLEGEPVTLADYAGQTLFLNFWQTTCPPCVRELPAFADFAADQGPDGAAVLAVNFDETSGMIRDFFDANEISGVPVALDPDSRVRRSYAVLQIPVTFVIGPDSVIYFMHMGEMTLDEMEEYAELIEEVAAA